MIVELLSVTAMLVGGCAAIRTAGVRGWPLAPLGFLAGVCLLLTIGLVQVVTPLPTGPALTLALTLVLPVAWWMARWRRGHDVAISVPHALVTLAGLGVAVALLRVANLVKWHTDSLRYLMAGSLLADGNYASAMSTHDLTKRLIGIPLLHAPANLQGEDYLRSVTALVAAATLGTFVWCLRLGLRKHLSSNQLALFTLLCVLLLVTNNRFVFSAFYLNGHLLFGVLLLLAVATGWLLATANEPPIPGLQVLQLMTIPAMVVTRPEAPIAVGLAILPTLLIPTVSTRYKATLLATFGTALILWHGFVLWIHLDRGAEVPFTISGMAVAGILVLLLIPLLRWHRLLRVMLHPNRLLLATEAGLWFGLLLFAVREPGVLTSSAAATVQNVVFGFGKWGLSLVALMAIVVVVAILARPAGGAYLRFPVTTFLPMAFLLVYLRGEAYRVGYGDSLSRMFMQVVPLAVLYVVVAVASTSPSRSAPTGADPPAGANPPAAGAGDSPGSPLATVASATGPSTVHPSAPSRPA